jgi:hypothetical protein
MFALPSFQLSSACTIEKESEVHVMWATQDKLSNDVADYFILFYFFPLLQGLFPSPPPPPFTNGFYQTNASKLHTQSHETISFFSVFFSLYLILEVIGIWLGDNLDPENPHAHKYTHTQSPVKGTSNTSSLFIV